ncbi:MAG: thymidine kinase [Micropruina sp.]|uniref:thymidine kinase n=1 Tax=Micropruina sp. TaxID=2737536 RepID=UPI0039E24E1D
MTQLIFFTGPMNCGKSTLALQTDFTETQAGRSGRVFTRNDRAGAATISSRIGLEQPAIEVTDDFDFWRFVIDELTHGRRVDYLICDEAHFYAPEHIDQLARIVDELQLDVYCFAILTDFRTELFPATRRLVELCDRMELLQVRPRCWCGEPATHNARTVDGAMVTEGSQVMVGDVVPTDDRVIAYEVLCRRHHRRRMTSAVASVTLNPEPLPFG